MYHVCVCVFVQIDIKTGRRTEKEWGEDDRGGHDEAIKFSTQHKRKRFIIYYQTFLCLLWASHTTSWCSSQREGGVVIKNIIMWHLVSTKELFCVLPHFRIHQLNVSWTESK